MPAKVTAVCCYRDNIIMSLTLVTRHSNMIALINNEADRKKFKNFHELYKAIIDSAKYNGYDIPYYVEFGVKWYDIVFYDYRYPAYQHRIPYSDDI